MTNLTPTKEKLNQMKNLKNGKHFEIKMKNLYFQR